MKLRNKFIYSLLFIVILFTGCGHKEPEILIQKEIENIYVLPPKDSCEKIIIPAPIAREKYMILNIKDKEKELGIYVTKLLSSIKADNEKKEELFKYLEEYEKKNKK